MIRIVAAVLRDAEGRVLLVRKRGTEAFMQPGGKREPGEDDRSALVRELREELGCAVHGAKAAYLGTFTAPAAHEPGQSVEAAVYAVETDDKIAAHAEIEELIWVDPAAPVSVPLAPLTRDHILPLVAESHMLSRG